MSVITKRKILERIRKGEIAFKPELDKFQLRSQAIDLRLGYTFLLPKMWRLTEKGREAVNINHFSNERLQYFDTIELEKGQYFELLPREYVLVSTLESIKVPADLMAVLYPRSSVNRKGLSVDLTGIVDSGYEGQLVIPVRNNTQAQVVRLYPGERFCQVVFEQLEEEAEVIKSRYHKKDIVEGFVRNSENSKEDDKEIDLIQSGNILELKEKYKIDN